MPLVVTQAIVLHAFDYLESSRVLRLLTREAGVQSVIAKGARRTRGRVGTGVDLFAQGEAQVHISPARDLHTLASFDVTASRSEIALEMQRFTAASALAELTLRVAGDDVGARMFDDISRTLDAITRASGGAIVERALAGAWRMIADAGFTPELDGCAMCHAVVPADVPASFSHSSGGVLCVNCARRVAGVRQLPVAARDALRRWLDGQGEGAADETIGLGPLDARAHQRLLREFIHQHVLPDDRPLRAFSVWESGFGEWAGGAPRG